jgi:hypothetical protein
LKFEQNLGIVYLAFRTTVLFYPVFMGLEFLEDGFGPLGVVPKTRIERLLLFFFDLNESVIDVKDTSSNSPDARANRAIVLSS